MVSSADEHGGASGPAPRPARSREVPLGHALLAAVVAVAGGLLVVQSVTPAPRPVELVAPARAVPAPAPPAVRVASVADALLLRAAFSAVPDLRVTASASGDAAGRPASLTTGLFGAAGLRPAGLALPSPTSGATPEAVSGVLWSAYELAARRVSSSCGLSPSLLAAIGEVESGSLSGRRLDARHNVVPPVLGPILSGNGVAAIGDTDDGRWDGDPTWDRAVGPMQFIPGTWRTWGSDGNGDGVADPQNVEDATYSTARYLCAGGRDLSDAADLRAAILSYNHSMSYLARVLELMSTIEPGMLPRLGVATGTRAPGPSSPASGSPTPYAVSPGPAGTSSSAPPTSTTQPGPTGSAGSSGTPSAGATTSPAPDASPGTSPGASGPGGASPTPEASSTLPDGVVGGSGDPTGQPSGTG